MHPDFILYYTLIVVALTIVVLVTDRFKASTVFAVAALLLVVGGSLGVQDLLNELANKALLSIFILIALTAGINSHFNLSALLDRVFRAKDRTPVFLLKMTAGVSAISAFMNNTPVVAMLMPYVYQWGKNKGVGPAKLLMPLSFAAIVGGVITLIGTSTNLVLNGLLIRYNQEPLDFFDFTLPGLLITLVSVLFLSLFAPYFLKDRSDALQIFQENSREYLIETRLTKESDMVGKTIEEAGMRNLDGVFLSAIIRSDKSLPAVAPDTELEAEDILLFAGETTQVMQLIHQRKGLELSKMEKLSLDSSMQMMEAVVPQNSGLDHKNVKEIGFREKYDAAIIGIHRRGEKLSGKIGQMEIKSGDLLLLMAGPDFQMHNGRHQELIIINKMAQTKPMKKLQKRTFWLGSLALIAGSIGGLYGLFECLLLLLLLQAFLGMATLNSLKKSISFDLLLILLSSLGLGQALIQSGAAEWLVDLVFVNRASWSPLMTVAMLFGITFILTSLITNVAAISIVFPIVLSLAVEGTLPAELLFLTAAFAASCCFATPFAYQTNLMVMELGKYKFMDFVKLGLPLSLLYALVFLAYGAVAYDLI